MTTLGINSLQGVSPDNVLAWVLATKPRFCIVINEPNTAALLQQHAQVIYRVKSADSDDDQALAYDPYQFVLRRHNEAPAGALLQLSNEPGRGNLGMLNEWTLEALRAADHLKRNAVILNFSLGTPEPHDWEKLRGCMAYAKRNGHYYGEHNYWHGLIATSIPYYVGRYRYARKALGADMPDVIITEVGYDKNLDSGSGWNGVISADTYARQLIEVGNLYRADGVLGACVFCYGDPPRWASFDISQQNVITHAIAQFNASGGHTVTWTRQLIKSTGASTNIRQQPNTTSAVIGSIPQAGVVGDVGDLSNSWYPVRVSGKQGYVHQQFVTFEDVPTIPGDGFIQLPEIFIEDSTDRETFATILEQIAASIRQG